MVGDPEWIGILERPDAPYGPNNKFIARYAFIAVPIGNALDLNAIHNQVFDEGNASSGICLMPARRMHYFRNQGVGSWEINLAAFLADLNTNEWGKRVSPAANTITPDINAANLSNNRGVLLTMRVRCWLALQQFL